MIFVDPWYALVVKSTLKKLVNSLLRWVGVEVRSIYSAGHMFTESFELLKTVLPPGPSTVVDVGVALGTPELYAAFPPATHPYLLIEANPLYRDAVVTLGRSMGAVVETVFCSDHAGTESFITRDTEAAKGSKYARKNEINPTTTVVPAVTLDSLLNKHNMHGPYILKIDVEGAELEVLRGATVALKKSHAVIIETPIILRMHGASSFGDIVSFLTQQGFVLFDIAEISYNTNTRFLNLTNGIFIKKDNYLWQVLSQPKTR
jgi:FkbM family methyltransferase